ncbi:uncharacterized protein LOC124917583 [Impatiens glandulifera]|uniref:uncharacterized protein LOC124917583 n=1 Tax=Impatiens glandulifera TaxID=253017 RepID=UPI001FB1268B|nr:uncharacterized protein LOC124917583 [Impatiens glandulifera]
MFRDDARIWWQGEKSDVDRSTISWEEFKDTFYGKYFTHNTRNKLAREFLEIRQGDAIMDDYVKRFERGRYFAPMILGSAAMDLNHFMEGLNATIRRDVRLNGATTIRETIEKALMEKNDNADIIKESQGPQQQQNQQKKIQSAKPAVLAKAPVMSNPVCTQCGQFHQGEYLYGTNFCYNCKKQGNLLRDCPQKKAIVPGRVFVMNQEEVNPDSTIITGNLRIANTLSNTLIDTGSTHSFVSANFVQKSGLRPDETKTLYSISLPSGMSLNINNLGMDWLTHHEDQIDCKKKTVSLTDQDGRTFQFRATPPPNPSYKAQ